MAKNISKTDTDGNYILGLDLGVKSIGWAVIPLDMAKISEDNIRLGVRCFDVGADDDGYNDTDSSNVNRRNHRSSRRLIERKRRMKGKLFHILQAHNMLPPGESKNGEQRHNILLALDKELHGEYLDSRESWEDAYPWDKETYKESRSVERDRLLYTIRANALDDVISLEAFGRVLYHLSDKRGYENISRKLEVKKEDGKVKKGIDELTAAMEEVNARTIGEYFSQINSRKNRIRGRYTGRDQRKIEFHLMWDQQATYYPDVLTAKLKDKVYNAIFNQRPLKSQKSKVGACELEPKQRRIIKADMLFQRFRYWQTILHLYVSDENGDMRKLTEEEQDTLAEALDETDKLSFAKIRKLLGFERPRAKAGEPTSRLYTFNMEYDGEDTKGGIIGNKTKAGIISALKKHGVKYDDDLGDKITHELLQYSNHAALTKRLKKVFGYSDELAGELAGMKLELDYASLSRKAITNLMTLMVDKRLAYSTACKELYPSKTLVRDVLPPVVGNRGAYKWLNNPRVIRALTELRKVVNALIKEYGKPGLIRIELARDLDTGRERRSLNNWVNNKRRAAREEARKAIIEHTSITNPNERDIEKWLLAYECQWTCPYTGKAISYDTLFGDNPQFDIEHIIPFSRCGDNSMANKTLCYNAENRNVKKNLTPWECYGHTDKWDAIIKRVENFKEVVGDRTKKPKRKGDRRLKLEHFKTKDIKRDFDSSMLNDTRYISKQACEYLSMLYGGLVDEKGVRRIQTNSGGCTAWLRNMWKLNTILNDENVKNREDNRHHAIDAAVIAVCSPKTVKDLAYAAKSAEHDQAKRLFMTKEVTPPVTDFLDILKGAVEKIIISYRTNHKITGKLHADTMYGLIKGENKYFGCKNISDKCVRIPVTDDKFPKQIPNIIDKDVREAVQKQYEANGRKPFTHETLPVLIGKKGQKTVIRRVRVFDSTTTVPVGRFNFAPGNNNHLEIYSCVNNGKETWKCVVVPTCVAKERERKKQPIVQTDFGPGTKFICSLKNGDYVYMEEKLTHKMMIQRVKGFSDNKSKRTTKDGKTIITVIQRIDFRPLISSKDYDGRISPDQMRIGGLRKIHVNVLGEVKEVVDGIVCRE